MARNSFQQQTENLKFLPTSTLIDIWERAGYVYETSIDLSTYNDDTALAASTINRSVFISGSRPVVIFSRELCFNGDGVSIGINRDPNYNEDGSLIEYFNSNDINPQPNYPEPTTEQEQGDRIYSGGTFNNENYGTQSRALVPLFGNSSNQSQGGIQAVKSPQIIAPFKSVVLVIANRDSSAQDVSSVLRWASPPSIEDYIFSEDGSYVAYKGPIDQVTE